jgi:hypothetical protein
VKPDVVRRYVLPEDRDLVLVSDPASVASIIGGRVQSGQPVEIQNGRLAVFGHEGHLQMLDEIEGETT